MIQRFNIRVYGILIEQGRVLLSRENYRGRTICKFPGGGLEYGEGLEDALKREFMEEIGLPVNLRSLFYVNEFFQQSAFSDVDQVISVYYFIEMDSRTRWQLEDVIVASALSDTVFYWQNLETLRNEDLTFPIDQVVVRRLKEDEGMRGYRGPSLKFEVSYPQSLQHIKLQTQTSNSNSTFHIF